jgi:hypothetical protein
MNRAVGLRPNLHGSIVARAAATALLAILLNGCGNIDAPVAKLQGFKSVGIISAIGDELTLTQAGLTGLADNEQRFSIEPWGIDDLIVARAGALLAPRFQVQPVTYPRAAFAARQRDAPIAAMNLLRDDPIKELVRKEVSPQGLDAYVVITKATSKYGSRGRTVTGIGIINRGAVFGSYVQLHTLYMITMIDGHELNGVGKRTAAPLGSDEIVKLTGPSRQVDTSLLPTASNAPASDQALKAATIDLIERSLPATLQDLRLVDR